MPKRSRYTPEQREEVNKLMANGLSYKEISKLTGVPEGTLASFKHRKSKRVVVRRFRRVPENLIPRIVELRDNGKSFVEVGRSLGLSASVCGRIYRDNRDTPLSPRAKPATKPPKVEHPRDLDALFELLAEYTWKFMAPKLEAAVDEQVKSALRKVVG